MKTYVLSVLLVVAAICCAKAAPPSDASIEQMLKATHADQMVDQMITQMSNGMQQGMQQALQGRTPTPAQQAKIEEFRTKLTALLRDELSFAKMKDIYIQVYRDTFTQDEINSIVSFYSTPGGKALVEKMPVAMQKSGALAQARMGPLLQKIQALSEQYEKEIASAH